MVEVLARLDLLDRRICRRRIAGVLAKSFAYETVFLMGLIVPALSVSGALLVRLRGSRRRALDWRIFGGGILLAGTATLLALSAFRFAQEIVFLVSLAVICLMLRRVMGRLTPEVKQRIARGGRRHLRLPGGADAGRGLPLVCHGPAGLRRDVLRRAALTGTGVGLTAMWLLTDAVVRRPAPRCCSG